MFPIMSELTNHAKSCLGKTFQNPTKINKLKYDVVFKEIHKDDGKKEFQCKNCENIYAKKNLVRRHFNVAHREKKLI